MRKLAGDFRIQCQLSLKIVPIYLFPISWPCCRILVLLEQSKICYNNFNTIYFIFLFRNFIFLAGQLPFYSHSLQLIGMIFFSKNSKQPDSKLYSQLQYCEQLWPSLVLGSFIQCGLEYVSYLLFSVLINDTWLFHFFYPLDPS